MPRPRIPVNIARAVLKESGHRCAVCGSESPLEVAHIVPWHKSKTHKAEDLICLCANCHARADLNNWGAKVLRSYKKEPWVLRQRTKRLQLDNDDTHSFALPSHRTNPLAKRFWPSIAALKVSAEIKKSIQAVLLTPDYPSRMSIAGTLVRNPVWAHVPSALRHDIIREHRKVRPTACEVMHLDILLTRSSDLAGRAFVHTYYSPDWKTYLFPFRPWLDEDDPAKRNELNATHLAKYWPVMPNSIEVKPLRGKYAISAKPHAKHQDLTLYVFEFCSVIFKDLPKLKRLRYSAKQGKSAKRQWFDMHELRANIDAWSVNGDVIRAVNTLFSVNLRSLPDSLPPGYIRNRDL